MEMNMEDCEDYYRLPDTWPVTNVTENNAMSQFAVLTLRSAHCMPTAPFVVVIAYYHEYMYT